MKEFNWKKAEKKFTEEVCRYAEQLEKENKQPGIRACRRICHNSFGEIFSSMIRFAQMIVEKRLIEAIGMHLKRHRFRFRVS